MPELLRVEGLSAGYGAAVVLEQVSLAVEAGQSVAVLGRNGAGKTTLLTTLMGLTHRHAGRIHWRGADLATVPPFQRARAGLGWVPQERLVFPSLSVDEHLAAVALPGPWNAQAVYELFPALAQRRAHRGNQLSGGEQQMLAIARALVLNPALLLLDEPMEGLAPRIVQDLAIAIRRIAVEGTAILLVEQHARLALELSSQALVLERGRIVHRAPSEILLKEPETLRRLLSVA